MANVSPFQPLTQTWVFAASSAAGTPVQITPRNPGYGSYLQYLIANNGSTGVWVTLAGSSAGAAQTIPSGGTPGNAVWIEAGQSRVLTGPPAAWFNAQTSAGATTLYVTGGEGVMMGATTAVAGTAGNPALPSGATAVVASSGNVANATAAASLPAVAGKTNYVTGFEITGGGATVAALVTATLSGLVGGVTLSYVFGAPLGVAVPAAPLVVEFGQPIPASAANTAITLSMPALGAGNTNAAVNINGYVV